MTHMTYTPGYQGQTLVAEIHRVASAARIRAIVLSQLDPLSISALFCSLPLSVFPGYLRSFQREYISGGPRSASGSKYGDIEVENHGILADEHRMRSHSNVSFDAARILEHQKQLQREAKEAQRQARQLANHGAAS